LGKYTLQGYTFCFVSQRALGAVYEDLGNKLVTLQS